MLLLAKVKQTQPMAVGLEHTQAISERSPSNRTRSWEVESPSAGAIRPWTAPNPLAASRHRRPPLRIPSGRATTAETYTHDCLVELMGCLEQEVA